MTAYDIINKKKCGGTLTSEEISYFFGGYTRGEIPDYQVSALLMAICLSGMDERECADLTREIEYSGDRIDLSRFGSSTADKHSTGGVGDKTTLIVAPLVASLGVTVAKMSGRGLGHTGGTVDKLEAIAGYRASLTPEEFNSQVEKIGIAVIGQSGNLAPLDKKLYALRDVTATVDSIPLITSSIMGKKLAAGSKNIVLDVKCGSGSFMKTKEEARALAASMVKIGRAEGREVRAVITDMDKPLGLAVGNLIEVREAIHVLRGAGPADLREVAVALASEMVSMVKGIPYSDAEALARAALRDGRAIRKFREWITAQGGDDAVLSPDYDCFAEHEVDLVSERAGYITSINTEAVGLAAVALGAGREKKEDAIDYKAGILFHKAFGERVESGEIIATLYASDESRLIGARDALSRAITLGDEAPAVAPLILDRIR